LTFGCIDEAKRYCAEAEALIDAGNAPASLLEMAKPGRGRREASETMQKTLAQMIRQYLKGYQVTTGDKQWLSCIEDEIGKSSIGELSVPWALSIVREYKVKRGLTPATIRHRIGAIRRCLDWHVTIGGMPINPLRMLPARYASYNDSERASVSDAPGNDNARDRRIEPGEEERIRAVLSCDPGYIESLGVERGINPGHADEMMLLFDMAIETAMRLREMFTLSVDQIDIGRRTIFLDRTKNGDKRQVPMSSVIVDRLSAWKPRGRNGLLFSYWNGDPATLKRVTSKLSGRWRTVARLAGCSDLRFHDLRHEATSRLFERTNLNDTKISSITGHRDPRMLKRYANLRASDLAEHLW
jgi:integrase